jgi:hypothetical protein
MVFACDHRIERGFGVTPAIIRPNPVRCNIRLKASRYPMFVHPEPRPGRKTTASRRPSSTTAAGRSSRPAGRLPALPTITVWARVWTSGPLSSLNAMSNCLLPNTLRAIGSEYASQPMRFLSCSLVWAAMCASTPIPAITRNASRSRAPPTRSRTTIPTSIFAGQRGGNRGRQVVEREPQFTREKIPGANGEQPKRDSGVDRRFRNRSQGSVAAGDEDHVRVRVDGGEHGGLPAIIRAGREPLGCNPTRRCLLGCDSQAEFVHIDLRGVENDRSTR